MNPDKGYRNVIALAEASASLEAPWETTRAVDWKSRLIMTKNDIVVSNQHNYSLILANDEKLEGHFKLDAYRHQITVHGELPFGSYETAADFDEIIFTKLLSYLGSEYGIDNEKKAKRAVREAAASNRYDSLIDKLDELRWDGKQRIETMWSILLGAEDSDYTREAAKLFMRGAVCRAYATNGVQFDIMPILVGPQGCRKTSFCRNLALDPKYFEDCLGDLSKPDAARKVQSALVVEMAELSSIKRTGCQEAVKAFLTRKNDSFRVLYTDDIVKPPRRCVFIGTTNDYDFLSGTYWNRRYLPIECGLYEADFDWTDEEGVRYFFEQLWAEAIVWYKSDPKGIAKTLTPPPAILEEIRHRQDRFKVEDPWYVPIGQYLNDNVDRDICARELLTKALGIQPGDRKTDMDNCKKIHELMRNQFLDWERVEGKTKRLGEWGPQNSYYVFRGSCKQTEEGA